MNVRTSESREARSSELTRLKVEIHREAEGLALRLSFVFAFPSLYLLCRCWFCL